MKKILICLSLVFLFGCGKQIHVSVSSICSPNKVVNNNCIIYPTNQDTSINDLLFQEFKQYIVNALHRKNFVVVNNIQEADIAIFLDYAISEPSEHLYSYSTPVWGQTGVSSSYTTGTINSYGNGMASFSGTTNYTPSYGITGYQTHIGTNITYTRYMTLSAWDLNAYTTNEQSVPLWKTTVISTGSSGDLREVFPLLVAASTDYIAEDTGKQIDFVIFENDEKVKAVKGLIPWPQK